MIYGEAVFIIAEFINATYREIGVERRVEAKYNKDVTSTSDSPT